MLKNQVFQGYFLRFLAVFRVKRHFWGNQRPELMASAVVPIAIGTQRTALLYGSFTKVFE